MQRPAATSQALVPGAARLGLHKGEPYYSRKDVQELHTRAHWRRQGRDVKESELPHPAKQAKKRKVPSVLSTGGGSAGFAGWGGGTRGGSHRGPGGWGPWQRGKAASGAGRGAGAAGDADECDGELPAPAAAAAAGSGPAAAGGESTDMQLLYGLWQTEEWEPPPAVDGKVPRNEHGNVEVPPFAKVLPTGGSDCRHQIQLYCRHRPMAPSRKFRVVLFFPSPSARLLVCLSVFIPKGCAHQLYACVRCTCPPTFSYLVCTLRPPCWADVPAARCCRLM